MLVEFVSMKLKDDAAFIMKINDVCSYVETKKGKMLKVPIKPNKRDGYLHKIFDVSFTDKFMYIPVKNIKYIK